MISEILKLKIEIILFSSFFLCVFFEYTMSRIQKKILYYLPNSYENLVIAGISLLSTGVFSLVSYPLLQYISVNCSISIGWQWESVAFLALFILTDFIDYWFHRFSHTVNLLWSAHIVHHQSEHYNLLVGLRFSPFVSIFNFIFILLPAFIGFSAGDIVFCSVLQGIYQMFIHTEFKIKLGFFEKILMTPSHHRVHHGKNEAYLDKNFGKCLIIWDKLFGTFSNETETVIFGVKDYNETNLNNHLFRYKKRLIKSVFKAKSTIDAVSNIFGSPEKFQEKQN